MFGIPDDERGEAPMAYVVLAENCEPTDELMSELKLSIKQGLAMRKYPGEKEFIDELPKTVTDKV